MKRDKQNQSAVSRRDFIKTTTAGAGAAALTGLAAGEANAQTRPAKWDIEADVIVIGAGATGLPAAIQAVEGGASVILVEANTDIGGHAMLSGGKRCVGRRHEQAEKIWRRRFTGTFVRRFDGLVRRSNPTGSPITGTMTNNLFAPTRTKAPRHLNGWRRMA